MFTINTAKYTDTIVEPSMDTGYTDMDMSREIFIFFHLLNGKRNFFDAYLFICMLGGCTGICKFTIFIFIRNI